MLFSINLNYNELFLWRGGLLRYDLWNFNFIIIRMFSAKLSIWKWECGRKEMKNLLFLKKNIWWTNVIWKVIFTPPYYFRAIFVIDYDWLSLWLKCKWQQSISLSHHFCYVCSLLFPIFCFYYRLLYPVKSFTDCFSLNLKQFLHWLTIFSVSWIYRHL